MGSIYFHSPSGTAAVPRERAHLGLLTQDTAIALLLDTVSTPDLSAALSSSSMARSTIGPQGVNRKLLAMALGTFGDTKPAFVIDGEPVAHWQLLLNTLMEHGSDAMRLAVRIHAQCEIHCYAEGQDRAWLADLIRDALAEGVFQAEQSWPKVIDLLMSRDDEPVVLSYSVTEGFPNPFETTWEPEDGDSDQDSWYELPPETRWAGGLEWLRGHANATKMLRMEPDGWSDYRFGHELAASDLVRTSARQ